MNEKGIKESKKENYTAALSYFEQAWALDTSALKTTLLKATALNDIGRTEEAEQIYLYLVARNFQDDDLYFNFSILYKDLKKFDKALEYANKSMTVDSSNSENNSNLAEILLGLKNYKQAERYFKRAISLNKKNYLPYQGLGETYYLIKTYDAAAESLNSALILNKSDWFTYFLLYKVNSRQNNSQQACINYHLAVKYGLETTDVDESDLIKCN